MQLYLGEYGVAFLENRIVCILANPKPPGKPNFLFLVLILRLLNIAGDSYILVLIGSMQIPCFPALLNPQWLLAILLLFTHLVITYLMHPPQPWFETFFILLNLSIRLFSSLLLADRLLPHQVNEELCNLKSYSFFFC